MVHLTAQLTSQRLISESTAVQPTGHLWSTAVQPAAHLIVQLVIQRCSQGGGDVSGRVQQDLKPVHDLEVRMRGGVAPELVPAQPAAGAHTDRVLVGIWCRGCLQASCRALVGMVRGALRQAAGRMYAGSAWRVGMLPCWQGAKCQCEENCACKHCCARTHMRVCACVCMCARVCVCICTRMPAHICMHVSMCTYTDQATKRARTAWTDCSPSSALCTHVPSNMHASLRPALHVFWCTGARAQAAHLAAEATRLMEISE